MVLIYTYKITPRLQYVMKHIFKRMLLTEVDFTTRVEDFIAHNGPKLSYAKQPLQNEFFVRSTELLFDQGVSDIEIKVSDWDGVSCFFPCSEKSVLPYDIFAASFYLMSRYEEYLPHVKDEHGRYPAAESLAAKNNFLELPVIDIWVERLRVALAERFPEMTNVQRSYAFTPVIDVPVIFRYRKRGIIRTIGGTLVDLSRFRFRELFKRFGVLLGLKQDPNNVFDTLTALHKEHGIDALYFFLLADYSHYDKNVSVYKPVMRTLIKSVADYSIVSLMASYRSFKDPELLKKERRRLINFINRPVKRIRHRFNRLQVPETYREVVEAEFNEDYTMGYPEKVGFRAGTCTPFYFYDISYEEQLPLLVNPVAVIYSALYQYQNIKRTREKIRQLRQVVKDVNGHFNVVFSNDVLDFTAYNSITALYKEMIENH
ncbi:polysaccharide deacetylase family protein [Robertkochia sediminum]|uniref:polysaccharide deacetylase family protein n=1 Tax=Robertkochia sediminum TaxID=2785326 RepID=UPI001932372F|nr:polysaccharide deacetylase family protein [Robertkochia sediminum]MBL7472830.1 polysaccharide deacetylase family protein [Robertkochia sediminum]